MPLKIRTGPLASPATLPAVVSTVDPELGSELGRACARARRVASAARPMPPLASKDRRSIHPARGERFFMACPPAWSINFRRAALSWLPGLPAAAAHGHLP